MTQARIESAFGTHSIAFVEGLYQAYLEDPTSVPADWQAYFASFGAPPKGTKLGPSFVPRSVFNSGSAPARGNGNNGRDTGAAAVAMLAPPPEVTPPPAAVAPPSAPEASAPVSERNFARYEEERVLAGDLRLAPVGSLRPLSAADTLDIAIRQDRVDQLVRAYRVRGHMIAKIDPLGMPRPPMPELDPKADHPPDAAFDRRFPSRTIYGTETLTLREILERLRNTYCRSIGVEFMHIHDLEPKNWLQERMEGTENRLEISVADQRRILTLLTDAVILEEFIQRKYLGAKSFSQI